ncbi:TIGR03862 family flavoprotein [Hymenobacter sp. BT186]|uniref:TIGR03862 family flavoprotein n=1 Tax=Hymenobacter telluris TaxID=2816474 RepID=A0A939EVJ1_9BACT|nr:TIGR03862 family flavoprotein [Hymenobacter telluris]MBO0357949.1 TIGR03862 family flavoprotein [Hymenobacter telluris]MBW3373976.1 TIGR03862 family flavoprotein [Hymenobacter norwichensis]
MSLPSSVAIIGGGPAGLLAAQRLAEAGCRVTVYEAQATVGRKFLVAGHGGFNLTNAEDTGPFSARYGQQQTIFSEFLRHFSPQDLRQWAAALGIDTFVGTSNRVFPLAAHKPADLLRAWLNRLRELGVTLLTRHRWLGFAGTTGLLLRDETTGRESEISPDATVLALGGASWAKTGSDGSWVPAFEALGVECVPFAPSNCGAEVAWSAFFQTKVGRTPLKNIALSCNSQRVRGEIMLTEYGLEGTPVYALTPALRAVLAAGPPALLHLDLKPDLSDEQLLTKLQKPRAGRSLPDFLRQQLRLTTPIPTLLREVAPPEATATPEALAQLLRRIPLPVQRLRPLDEAISSAGGVAWPELDKHLMLRRRPGTFVAGEMLDWEAPTGGYLLQGCFSTGAWAAQGVAKWMRQ